MRQFAKFLPIDYDNDLMVKTESLTTATSDQILIDRIASRDREAFADLYDRYCSRIFGLIMRILRNRNESEDVLQEVFLQVWSSAEKYRPERGAPDIWLLMLARSRACDRVRKRKLQTLESLPDTGYYEDPAMAVMLDEDKNTARKALDILSQEYREVLCLSIYHAMTHEQIAQHLTMPLGTVKTRIRTGLTRLRDHLSQQMSGEPQP